MDIELSPKKSKDEFHDKMWLLEVQSEAQRKIWSEILESNMVEFHKFDNADVFWIAFIVVRQG